jgi:hypothetical protein
MILMTLYDGKNINMGLIEVFFGEKEKNFI